VQKARLGKNQCETHSVDQKRRPAKTGFGTVHDRRRPLQPLLGTAIGHSVAGVAHRIRAGHILRAKEKQNTRQQMGQLPTWRRTWPSLPRTLAGRATRAALSRTLA
jgi:hypothetical protein